MLTVLMMWLPAVMMPWQPSGTEVEVHEWGVVRFDDAAALVQGFPSDTSGTGPVSFDYGMMPVPVDAPVIFFHGSEFSGDLTVEVPAGEITEIYPRNGAELDGNTLVWRDVQIISSYLFEETADRRSSLGFRWENSVYDWRRVDANAVRVGDLYEGFLYYECAVPTVGPLDYPSLLMADRGLPEGVDEILLFLRPDDELQEMYTVRPCDMFLPPETDEISVYERGRVLRILESWAGERLFADETEAMWNTWEEYVTRGEWEGDALLIFPLPDDAVSSISTIGVDADGSCQISVERFFLGMVSVNWN
jgi:hypothetical protein